MAVQRGELEPVQWSAPANLDQVQRGSLALLRREVVTCAPACNLPIFCCGWQGGSSGDARGAGGRAGRWRSTACRDCRCQRKCGNRTCSRRECRVISRVGSTSGFPVVSACGCATAATAASVRWRSCSETGCDICPCHRPPILAAARRHRLPSAGLLAPARGFVSDGPCQRHRLASKRRPRRAGNAAAPQFGDQ